MFNILEDKTIPFEEKEKVVSSILTKYLDLKTFKLSYFVLFLYCIYCQFRTRLVFILYYTLLKNLIKAIKEGRISKPIGRAIVRRLQKKGIAVDPELLEVVNS